MLNPDDRKNLGRLSGKPQVWSLYSFRQVWHTHHGRYDILAVRYMPYLPGCMAPLLIPEGMTYSPISMTYTAVWYTPQQLWYTCCGLYVIPAGVYDPIIIPEVMVPSPAGMTYLPGCMTPIFISESMTYRLAGMTYLPGCMITYSSQKVWHIARQVWHTCTYTPGGMTCPLHPFFVPAYETKVFSLYSN